MSDKDKLEEHDDDPDDDLIPTSDDDHKEKRKISETDSRKDYSVPKKRGVCPDYFGVKSYLHNFYDTTGYKDPSVYEDEDDFRFLLYPHSRRRRCRSVWWKVFVWIGANMLLFGIIGILVGYLVPQKTIIKTVEERNDVAYINRGAMTFNTTLDLCKLIGVILFCLGGVTLAMALIFPSFMTNYCDDDVTEDPIKITVKDEEKMPLSPMEMTIPATSNVKGVQPLRKVAEAIVEQDKEVLVKGD